MDDCIVNKEKYICFLKMDDFFMILLIFLYWIMCLYVIVWVVKKFYVLEEKIIIW